MNGQRVTFHHLRRIAVYERDSRSPLKSASYDKGSYQHQNNQVLFKWNEARTTEGSRV